MNGLKYLLDTNIIIGLLKGNDAVIPVLRDISLTVCGFSAITRMELLSYPSITADEAQAINRFLERMTYLAISPIIEDLTIQFRHQYCVKLPDAIIAATAKTYGIELLTLDKKLAAKL
jgi:predicted nucleic acid-binding protein